MERKVPKATAFYSERKKPEQEASLVHLLQDEIIKYLKKEKGVKRKDLIPNKAGGFEYDLKKLGFLKLRLFNYALGVKRALWFYDFLNREKGVNEVIARDSILKIISNDKEDFPKGLGSSDDLRFYSLKTIYAYLSKESPTDIETQLKDYFNRTSNDSVEGSVDPPTKWKNERLLKLIDEIIKLEHAGPKPFSSIQNKNL